MELQSKGQQKGAVLGQGYDCERQQFKGVCLTGSMEFVGAQEGAVEFSRSLSNKEVSDSLGFSLGGKARYGVTEGSMAANYALDSSSNSFSEVTTYFSRYRFKNQRFRYTGLTPEGSIAKGNLAGGQAGENWVRTCGHEFVEQITLGATLYISLKVEFTSREEKEKFSAQARIKGPAASLSAEVKGNSQSFSSTGTITIQAYQIGGAIEKLSAIFGTEKATTSPDGKEVHALIACSMANPEACLSILDSAIQYATDTKDETAFPQQISPRNIGTSAGPAELSYITTPYTDVAIYSMDPLVSAGLKLARQRLSDKFEENLELYQRCRSLNSGVTFRVSPRQKKIIDNITKSIDRNDRLIHEAATICYSDLSNCISAVEAAMNSIVFIDSSELDILPETIAQWYDIKDLPGTKKSVKTTMNSLETHVRAVVNDFDKVADKAICVQEVVINSKELTLAGEEMDMTPLNSQLPELTKLVLVAQEIEFAPVSSFENLESLSLNLCGSSKDKDLTLLNLELCKKLKDLEIILINCDLSPLMNLASLQSLILSDSQALTGQAAIGDLTQIKFLEIARSDIFDYSFIPRLTELEHLTLDGKSPLNGDLSLLAPLKYLNWLFLRSDPCTKSVNGAEQLIDLPSLSTVCLEGVFLTDKDIKYVSEMKVLNTLQLVNNNISAVCHLQYGDRLTKFICCQNNIDSLDFLASLPNLECLILKGCGLVDITAISSLVKLKHLELDGNKIKDLTPLLCMHALEWLDIRGNEVIDCEPLKKADLPRLCHLAIDLNPIKDLRPLSKYTGLEYFTCYNEVFEYDCNGQQYIRG
jgi:hypothetical protein